MIHRTAFYAYLINIILNRIYPQTEVCFVHFVLRIPGKKIKERLKRSTAVMASLTLYLTCMKCLTGVPTTIIYASKYNYF